MTYALQPQDDGSIAVVCVPDDGAEELQSVNTGDNRRGLSDARQRAVLNAMVKKNRAFWRTGDAAMKEQTMLVHYTVQGERLELRRDGDQWVVALVSRTNPEMVNEDVPGTANRTSAARREDPDAMMGEVSGAVAGERPLRRMGDEAMKLRDMNSAAKRFWARGGR
jgi:hypothetical protein